MVLEDKSGIVTEPTAPSIAQGINRLYELGEHHFLDHLRKGKEKYSWEVLTNAIIALAKHN
jgi:hypothetical protein